MENFNRELHISTGGSRKAAVWKQETILWSDFVTRLSTPVQSTESFRTYLSMPKSKQDELKDVGGFVGGALRDGRRKAANVLFRDLLTLDLDAIPEGGTDDVLKRVDGLGCAYAIYSTRKHEPMKPRLRVIIPTDRSVTAEEYEPLARAVADLIGIKLCDPTTFEPSRLMYYPSVCADGQYIFTYGDKAPIQADGILAMYQDWKNWREWPQVPGHEDGQKALAAKQQDPATKEGVIGAFCRTYTIYDVIEKFLPGVYEPVDDSTERFTYKRGTTVGGAIVYEGGKFLYSHHATDPCSGKLVNAFDLLRLHKFGDLDLDARPDTPVNKLQSYLAACRFAVADEAVSSTLNRERYDKVQEAFQGIRPESDTEWAKLLELSPTTGKPERTIKNVETVIENDPALKGRIRFDSFSEYLVGVAPLPWNGRITEEGPFRWKDEDDAGLRDYMERILKFRSRDVIDDGLILGAKKNGFNPILEYLESLSWDGTPRLDALFIDYLGAEDCEYTREVTRKSFVAAVTRAKEPGVKYDTMTVIRGPQGIGKSTLLRLMGRAWYTNNIRSFEGKDAAELLQGIWIVEVDELDLMKKSNEREIKSFLSRTEDHYRAAYARKAEKHPRKSVIFGTTNDDTYLFDVTGNRRFLPIEAGVTKAAKSVFTELTETEIGQVWAEAFVRWQMGEPLILSLEMEQEAEIRRQNRTERDPLQGMIEEFINRPVPADWISWSNAARRQFWAGHFPEISSEKLVPRDRICAGEIWDELYGEYGKFPPRKEIIRINKVLKTIEGWEPSGIINFGPDHGKQRGIRRIYDLATNSGNKLLTLLPRSEILATKATNENDNVAGFVAVHNIGG